MYLTLFGLVGLTLTTVGILCHSHQHDQASRSHRLHNSKMAQDIEHVSQHLREKINVKKEMSPEELEFYYFMEHDFNNDSRLDGLEILSAIQHSEIAVDLNPNVDQLTSEELRKAYETEMNYYTEIIDEILTEDDFNQDGYLSYLEYVLARRRDQAYEKSLDSKNVK